MCSEKDCRMFRGMIQACDDCRMYDVSNKTDPTGEDGSR